MTKNTAVRFAWPLAAAAWLAACGPQGGDQADSGDTELAQAAAPAPGEAALPPGHPGMAADADAAAQPAALARCTMCHSFAEGEGLKIGPNLHGIVGRTAGTSPGYNYSPAMRDSGIVWTEQTLDSYLAAPGGMLPGTRMPMGEPDPAKRAEIIAFLKSNG